MISTTFGPLIMSYLNCIRVYKERFVFGKVDIYEIEAGLESRVRSKTVG